MLQPVGRCRGKRLKICTITSAQGIRRKGLQEEIGPGRGDVMTPGSSIYTIERDPFRSVRRGRQPFQRKFTRVQGPGPTVGDTVGNLNTDDAIGAGLSDSCALCHGRPKGSAGVDGNVATCPDSLILHIFFGVGLREMLADEMTTDLRNTRKQAIRMAGKGGGSVTLRLNSKGINYRWITTNASGQVDGSSCRGRVVSPSGMVLDGRLDKISPPPPPDDDSGQYEADPAVMDHLEFYLLNYFKA